MPMPDKTQKCAAIREAALQAHFNLAGEYNQAKGSDVALTLDEYCQLVKSFGSVARVYEPSKLTRSEEIEEILSRIGPA